LKPAAAPAGRRVRLSATALLGRQRKPPCMPGGIRREGSFASAAASGRVGHEARTSIAGVRRSRLIVSDISPGTVAPSRSVAALAAQRGGRPLLMQVKYSALSKGRKSKRAKETSSPQARAPSTRPRTGNGQQQSTPRGPPLATDNRQPVTRVPQRSSYRQAQWLGKTSARRPAPRCGTPGAKPPFQQDPQQSRHQRASFRGGSGWETARG
jgi:hypothetical protein